MPTTTGPDGRRSDDVVSGRLDRPIFPAAPAAQTETATDDAALVSTAPQPLLGAPRPVAPPSAMRTVLPAAAAVVAIAMVGWLIADSEPPASTAGHESDDLPTAMASGADPVTPAPAATVDAAAAPAAASADAAAPPAALAAAPAEPASSRSAGEELPSAGPLAGPLADVPTLDVVRVEPGAAAVLAGRAPPGSVLIVLDNGEPIGTAVADGNGEWALVGDAPLPAGRHELSLALKTPDGTVVVEQADTRAAATGKAGVAGLPTPAQKPAAGGAPVVLPQNLYVIQLASVPSAADAEREWTRLQAAYPALLGSRSVEVDQAEVGDRGTFYRLRTGPFASRDAARLLCRELNAAGQECLVVRAAGGP